MIVLIRYALIMMALTLASLSIAGAAYAGERAFSKDAGRVDLTHAVSFEEYVKSGTDEHRKATDERFASYVSAPFFVEGARKIDSPVVLLMIGMMYCPDCKAAKPYMEELARLNPLIRTKYMVRNDTPGAREFMKARTGRTNMPAIFAITPGGKVLDGAYVETPARVTALLEAAGTEVERDAIWDDFHNGVYDEDVQRDLLALVERAAEK
jgi:thiol-disulfide isomerase/thioredoxin